MLPRYSSLRRQNSSQRGYETTEAGHEIIAKNAARNGVTVLPSGVQIECLTKDNIGANGTIPQHKWFDSHAERENVRWTVQVAREYPNGSVTTKSDETMYSLRSVPRGLRDALLTGNFEPGTLWRVLIPGEHAGGLREEPDETNVFILRIGVLDVHVERRSLTKIIAGFLYALAVAIFNFVMSQFIRSVVPTIRRAASSSMKQEEVTGLLSDLDASSENTRPTVLRGCLTVDTEDVGDCDLEIFAGDPIATFITEAVPDFRSQPILVDDHGVRLIINSQRNDADQFSDEQVKQCTIRARSHLKDKDADDTYGIFVDAKKHTLILSRLQNIDLEKEKSIALVGRVIGGQEALSVVLNCADGGVLTDLYPL